MTELGFEISNIWRMFSATFKLCLRLVWVESINLWHIVVEYSYVNRLQQDPSYRRLLPLFCCWLIELSQSRLENKNRDLVYNPFYFSTVPRRQFWFRPLIMKFMSGVPILSVYAINIAEHPNNVLHWQWKSSRFSLIRQFSANCLPTSGLS